jgi:hypothetical protein
MTIKRHNGEWRKISLSPAPEGQPMKRIKLGADNEDVDAQLERVTRKMREVFRRQGLTDVQIDGALGLAKDHAKNNPGPINPAPRSIYEEPWMRRILDMTKKGE